MKTTDIINRIRRADSSSDAWEAVPDSEKLESQSSCIKRLLKKANTSTTSLAAAIGLERSALHRIVNDSRPASRNVLLRIALALKLNVDETQMLLKCCRRCALSPRVRRDALILFCILHHYDIIQTEDALTHFEERSLYERA